MAEKSLDEIEKRSTERVTSRMTEDAPCNGGESVLCPFCDRPLRVRRTVLGRLNPANDGGERPHIDGVQMKCSGQEGCGFRPDFDVPMHKEDWEDELAARGGERLVDMGFSPYDGDKIAERLRNLGYIVGTEV